MEHDPPLPAPEASPMAGPQVIRLDADLGIGEAAPLKALLCAAVDAPGLVELDGHAVEDIHTAALELFCLFCRDRRRAGRETRWLAPSPVLRSAAALLGLSSLLSLDPIPAGEAV